MSVRPTRVRRLRIRKAMGNAVLASAVLAAGLVYVAVQKTVTLIVDDGHPEAVRTMSTSVGDLLEGEGIVLGAGDLVTPAAVTPLADGMTVLVDRGWVATTTDVPAAADVGVWVMEGVSAPHQMLAARSTEGWFSAEAPSGPSSVVAATVVVKGKDHDVVTNAAIVRELLSAMGIEPDGDDRVLPSPRTPIRNEMRVRFDRVVVSTQDVRVPIPYTTSTEYTDRLDPGAVRVIRAGVDGVMIERTSVTFVNGEAVRRMVLSRAVVTEAVSALRQVGRAAGPDGTQVGEASWYGFAPGDGLTAAHPWLAFGTVVTVENLANGRTVQVVINDRGPFGGRIIDLSDQAFARIASLSQGVCQVRLTW
jgi:resuscitation-promoting factor RpfB